MNPIFYLRNSLPAALFLLSLFSGHVHAQWPARPAAPALVTLTIEDAYLLAEKGYPLSRQRELLEKTRDYTVANAAKGYLPQLNFAGQGTTQSDVTNLPVKIPGFIMPQYSKEQYKIYGEIDQVIYEGGLIRNQQQSAEVDRLVKEKSLDVELYALHDRINQLFFGILLLDRQLEQNSLLQADIQNGIDKADAQEINGTGYRMNVDELQAQLLQAKQARIEENMSQKAYLEMLGSFTGLLPDAINLVSPPEPLLSDTIRRPELLLYDYQKRGYDLQDRLADAQLRPRVSLFFQGGYGRPALNLLSNDPALYYISGLRLSWTLGGLYTRKYQRQLSELGRRDLGIGKETFLFNTNLARLQNSEEIRKYRQLMLMDDGIIILRSAVKRISAAQLANGILNAHDYLVQVYAEDQARQARILHQVQLLQSMYNYRHLTGEDRSIN